MEISSAYIEIAVSTLRRIRERSPLILCLTNSVVQSISANVLLAAGAAPVMLCDADEIEELLGSVAGGLLVNLGTLSQKQAQTMRRAIRAANANKRPWVLDPVAVGGLSLRTDFAREILALRPTLIRGNASEILALAGFSANARGPESTCKSDAAVEAAQQLARQTGASVLVTGEIDYVTDGTQTAAFGNGHVLMTRVTGVGCSMGAFAAAALAATPDPFDATVATALIYGIAGDLAAERTQAPGSFAVALLDALYQISENDLRSRAKVLA